MWSLVSVVARAKGRPPKQSRSKALRGVTTGIWGLYKVNVKVKALNMSTECLPSSSHMNPYVSKAHTSCKIQWGKPDLDSIHDYV
ncbi:hypothetical protein BaRGS_00014729 [Batillaria attramentaria]|uniref:Uncharacterized protein n=1 Tax=Batillaria attramentaria TaxID=370345 RepID=A0ABD0L461_9CAEN